MQFINKSKILVFLIALMLGGSLLTSCNDSTSSTSPSSGDKATVQGQVTNDQGQDGFGKIASGVEGATVTMAEVKSDGSLETVSTSAVETDANGYFTSEVTVTGKRNLVVVAKKGNTTWNGIVTGEVNANSTTSAEPINDETTVEANIFADMQANGQVNNWTITELKSTVNSKIAAEVKGNADTQASLSAAIQNKVESEQTALRDSVGNLTSAQIEQIGQARLQAQAQFEADLYAAAGDQNAEENARRNYRNQKADGYRNNGADDDSRAQAQKISAKILVESATDISADAKASLRQYAEYQSAIAIDNAMQAKFEGMGSSSTEMSAVANAGATLRSDIQTASSDEEIMSAFNTYHDSIVATLSQHSKLGADATVISQIDSGISSSAGPKVALESAINASVTLGVDIQAIVNAYITFFNAVKSMVHNSLTVSSDAEVNAVTNILILANIEV